MSVPLAVLDSPEVDLLSKFSQCFEFIEEAQRKKSGVLVHCFAGRSRR
jgi:protein-tyrosine phosphatase